MASNSMSAFQFRFYVAVYIVHFNESILRDRVG